MFLGHPPHADGAPDARQLRVVRGEERVIVEGSATAAAVVVLPVAADHRLVLPHLEEKTPEKLISVNLKQFSSDKTNSELAYSSPTSDKISIAEDTLVSTQPGAT